MRVEIREIRDLTGLSQSRFAERFEIPVSTLRKWEQGETTPPHYVVKMLSAMVPKPCERQEKIICKDGSVFYYDKTSGRLSDQTGDQIRINADLDGVKRENLHLYVHDLFESYYEIREKFERDCEFDKKEDIIWS